MMNAVQEDIHAIEKVFAETNIAESSWTDVQWRTTWALNYPVYSYGEKLKLSSWHQFNAEHVP